MILFVGDILPLNFNDSQPLFNSNSQEDYELRNLFPNATGVDLNTTLLENLIHESGEDSFSKYPS